MNIIQIHTTVHLIP